MKTMIFGIISIIGILLSIRGYRKKSIISFVLGLILLLPLIAFIVTLIS